MDRAAPWGMAGLLLYVLAAAAAGWRYFPGFSGDHAWYLQVALRVSQGDVLYRDVAWAYGPLPAQALAALFRLGGPDAAWASLVNGLLAAAGILLTYAVARSLLTPGLAFAVTLFAAIVGPNAWSGLFRTYYYVYTQAIAWGAAASLAALAAALRWQQSRRGVWLALAGLTTAFAILSKPEFGLVALAAGAAALAAGRATPGAWLRYLAASALLTAAGFGWQAWQAGLWPVWRGYTGYDQLTSDSPWLWGTRLGNKRLLLGGYALWLALAALWASGRWPRWRRWFLALAGAAGLLVLAVAMIYLLDGSLSAAAAFLRHGSLSQVRPAGLLSLAALPWAPLLPLLLIGGWLARGRSLSAAWWAVWAYAVASSLRPLLTGYANPFAAAPALAVFWVWIEERLVGQPARMNAGRRLLLAGLAALAALNLLAQAVAPSDLYTGPRAWIDTALGPIRIPQDYRDSYATATALVEQQTPAGAPIFAAGYGAQWYLLAQRPNPTAFDLMITGMGASGEEAASLEASLLARPPHAVLLPGRWRPESGAIARDAREAQAALPAWWQSLQRDYVDATPAGVGGWRVLLRREGSSP